jgi:hypothetical protein
MTAYNPELKARLTALMRRAMVASGGDYRVARRWAVLKLLHDPDYEVERAAVDRIVEARLRGSDTGMPE